MDCKVPFEKQSNVAVGSRGIGRWTVGRFILFINYETECQIDCKVPFEKQNNVTFGSRRKRFDQP